MDYIVRMIAKDAPIVAMAIQGHDLVNRAQEIHHTFPVATAALGRTLLIASMMGEQLKRKTALSPFGSRAAALSGPFWPCQTARETYGARYRMVR